MPMAMDDRTALAQLTPGMRRELLRAFADRMLLKITAMDDPEDLPGVERAVRVAAVIERVYSRCDRAERQIRVEAPNLLKAEAECATHKTAAIEARVALANTLKWESQRRRDLGPWWDAAQSAAQSAAQNAAQNAAPQAATAPERPASSAPGAVDNETPEALPEMAPDTEPSPAPGAEPRTENVTYADYTDDILEAQAHLGLRPGKAPAHTKQTCAERAKKPPPPA